MQPTQAQAMRTASKLNQLISSLHVVDSMAEQIVNDLANDKSIPDADLIKPTRIRESIVRAKSRADILLQEYRKFINQPQNG